MMKTLFSWTLILAVTCMVDIASALTLDQIEAYENRIEERQQQLDEMRTELKAMKAEFKRAKALELFPTTPQDEKKDKEVKQVQKEKDVEENRFIYRKNKNLTLTFSGRLHRMFLGVDDGRDSDIYFTDSEQGPTMLRLDATGKISDEFSIGGSIETGIRQNRPFLINQDNTDAGTSVNVRAAEVRLDSSSFGKLSLGRGFASAWLAPEIDLSGTQFANLLPVGMLAPGMKFIDASDNSLSDIQVLTYFVDVERLLIVDRVRYDSPGYGPGLQLSGSASTDDRWDLALRLKPQPFGSLKLVAGASYQDRPFEGIDRRWDGVVSVLHSPTGINLTIGGSSDRLTLGRDANSWIIKAGWLTDIFSIGKTAFSVDYYNVSDLRLDSDEGNSYGLFAVQKWPDFGVDFYLGHRVYEVSRPDINLKNINVSVMGAAFNF